MDRIGRAYHKTCCKACGNCDNSFVALRKDALFCSVRCRVAFHRAKDKAMKTRRHIPVEDLLIPFIEENSPRLSPKDLFSKDQIARNRGER